jgi:hypothetical protein
MIEAFAAPSEMGSPSFLSRSLSTAWRVASTPGIVLLMKIFVL